MSSSKETVCPCSTRAEREKVDSRDSHCAPEYMERQVQVYPGAEMLSVQVPWFRQGLEAQLIAPDLAIARNSYTFHQWSFSFSSCRFLKEYDLEILSRLLRYFWVIER